MRPLVRLLIFLLSVSVCGLLATPARAQGDSPTREKFGWSLKDTSHRKHSGSKRSEKRHIGSGTSNSHSNTEYEKRIAEWKAYESQLKTHAAQMQVWQSCLQTTDHSEKCALPTGPTAPEMRPGEVTWIPANTLSDEDAAYIAFARLRLTPPTPIIAPSPDLNQWKMAAVGYPLWLSVEGDPDPPAVADTVADVHVRLEAHLAKVVFSMGDRHAVTCTNVTTRWSESVRGKDSPACGYRYQKPSLPKRSYTVTATTYWSVAWSTSRGAGVIPFVQASSTQLPVGELQVLVR